VTPPRLCLPKFGDTSDRHLLDDSRHCQRMKARPEGHPDTRDDLDG
jgi:hypothetical protein